MIKILANVDCDVLAPGAADELIADFQTAGELENSSIFRTVHSAH
jgi:hypothetical protein